MRYIVIAFILYTAYRFIFHFLIPVIITTLKVRKRFKEMQSRMPQQQQAQQKQPEPVNKEKEISKDDYIDYEELDT